jgi:hypothetical protein
MLLQNQSQNQRTRVYHAEPSLGSIEVLVRPAVRFFLLRDNGH